MTNLIEIPELKKLHEEWALKVEEIFSKNLGKIEEKKELSGLHERYLQKYLDKWNEVKYKYPEVDKEWKI